MSRSTNTKFAPLAKEFLGDFHADIVSEVQRTVFEHDVVVVGMFFESSCFLCQTSLGKGRDCIYVFGIWRLL